MSMPRSVAQSVHWVVTYTDGFRFTICLAVAAYLQCSAENDRLQKSKHTINVHQWCIESTELFQLVL